jgi:putative MATE family efflux protein
MTQEAGDVLALRGGTPREDALQAQRGENRPQEASSEDGQRGPGRRRSAYATRDLTTGSIPRNLFFLAWPQFIEGVLNVLDQMADLFWAGRGFGTRAIAGIGVAQNYTMLIMTARFGIDMAMRAMVSRAVGAGNIALANHIALQAFTLSGLFSLTMMVLGVLLTEPLLRLLGISDAVIAEGAAYMRAQFVGTAGMSFRMMSGAALQASGDTLTPMKATTATRVIHLALAPFLAFGWWVFPDFGLMGLALANIAAQSAGVAMNFYALFTGTSRLHLTLRGYYLDFPLIWRIATLGAPAAVTQIERALSQLVIVGLVAPFGDYALAAYSLTRRTEMFMNMGSWGIGQSAGTLVGQNLGAGRPERAKAAVLWASGYVLLVKGLLGGLLFAFPTLFISVFSSDHELLPLAITWLRIQVLGYLAMGVTQVAVQSFQTAGDTFFPMVVTLVTMWGLEVPLAYALSRWTSLGQFGVAWGIVAAMFARVLIYVPYFIWGGWLRKRVIEDLPRERTRAWRLME